MKWVHDIALLSKDESTKVGAVIWSSEDDTLHSFGYNGMPRGMNDQHTERQKRPEKYFWFEHGERNAIFNSVRHILTNKIILTTDAILHMDDARAIVSTGIKKIVISENTNLDNRILSLFLETNTNIIIQEKTENIKLKKFFELAKSLQNNFNTTGASIIIDEHYTPIARGFRDLPYGFDIKNINQFSLTEQEQLLESSIKSAIYKTARKNIKNSTIFVTFIPCIGCAKAILTCGINKVICPEPTMILERDLRWKESFQITQKLFNVSGIETHFINEEYLSNNIPKTSN